MAQYMQVLRKLEDRETELDELQLDREELRRLRQEAEARLSSTTQRYEQVQSKLQEACVSEKQLQERCHVAEEALRAAKEQLGSLHDDLAVAQAGAKKLRAEQRKQRKDIQKAAAVAANDEVRAQTELFESKLRAKEAKVKDARKIAKTAVKEAKALKKACSAEVEALTIKLRQAKSNSGSGLDPFTRGKSTSEAAAYHEDDHATRHTETFQKINGPLLQFFEEHEQVAADSVQVANEEVQALRAQLQTQTAQRIAEQNAVAQVTRRQQKKLRLDLQQAKAALDVARAELALRKQQYSEPLEGDAHSIHSTISPKDATVLLHTEILELKKAAARSEQIFLQSTLAGDDKYATLHDEYVALQQKQAVTVAESVRISTENRSKERCEARKLEAYKKELENLRRTIADSQAVEADRRRAKESHISDQITSLHAQIASLKAENALLLTASEIPGGDENDDPEAAAIRKLNAAKESVARTRGELEEALNRATSLSSKVHALKANLAAADRKAIHALNDLSSEVAASQAREVGFRSLEADAAARIGLLQTELDAANQRAGDLVRQYSLRLETASLSTQHLQQQLDNRSVSDFVDDSDQGSEHNSTLRQSAASAGMSDGATADRYETPDVREVQMLRHQLLAYARQEVETNLQRNQLEALVETNASKDELLAQLREDVANLRDDRDAVS